MRSKWAVWIVALMLCTSGAFAKSSSTSSSSSSRSGFSRGFSTSKPSGTSSKTDTSGSKSPFGSFSSTKSAPAPSTTSSSAGDTTSEKSTRTGFFSSSAPTKTATLAASGKSALSTGLDKNAAQENALKTFDQRTSTKTAATPTTDFGRGSSISDQRSTTPTYAPTPAYPQPGYAPPHTVIVHDNSSSFGSNLLWFMLGRSMSDHRHYDAPYPGGAPGQYQNAPYSPDIAVPHGAAPHESFGWTALRIFLWLGFLSIIGWTIWFFVRRKNQQAARRHYTL